MPRTNERSSVKLKDEFIVCHARGYPDPFRPVPNTLERAREFVSAHDGEIKYRVVSEWETVE
jgi:hypothetical protein